MKVPLPHQQSPQEHTHRLHQRTLHLPRRTRDQEQVRTSQRRQHFFSTDATLEPPAPAAASTVS